MTLLLDQEGLGFHPEAPDQVGISKESSKTPPRRGMTPGSVTVIGIGRPGKAFARALANPHCNHSSREIGVTSTSQPATHPGRPRDHWGTPTHIDEPSEGCTFRQVAPLQGKNPEARVATRKQKGGTFFSQDRWEHNASRWRLGQTCHCRAGPLRSNAKKGAPRSHCSGPDGCMSH
jgi:hypothetical protein